MNQITAADPTGIPDRLTQALDANDPATVRAQLARMHPSGIADVLESLPGKTRSALWQLIDPAIAGDVLSELQETVSAGLLEQMQPAEIAQATKHLDTDDAAGIIQELPEAIQDTVLRAMDEQNRRRVAWLCVNLATASLAASVAGHFQETSAQLVTLAVLMPIVANMGGVASSQTLTITIRGIALGQPGKSNTRSLLIKEISVALLNGLVLVS